MDRLERKKRIGILGGTFDPIHMGHLVLAETARVELGLDKVFFVPAKIPPHKKRTDIIDKELRYKMVKLAIAGNPAYFCSRFEIDKLGVSYSIETVRYFRKRFPEFNIYFISGSDAGPEFKSWKNVSELLNSCKFIVAKRPAYETRDFPRGVKLLKGFFIDLSSSEIRKRLKTGKSVRYLVPEKVHSFIENQGLYL